MRNTCVVLVILALAACSLAASSPAFSVGGYNRWYAEKGVYGFNLSIVLDYAPPTTTLLTSNSSCLLTACDNKTRAAAYKVNYEDQGDIVLCICGNPVMNLSYLAEHAGKIPYVLRKKITSFTAGSNDVQKHGSIIYGTTPDKVGMFHAHNTEAFIHASAGVLYKYADDPAFQNAVKLDKAVPDARASLSAEKTLQRLVVTWVYLVLSGQSKPFNMTNSLNFIETLVSATDIYQTSWRNISNPGVVAMDLHGTDLTTLTTKTALLCAQACDGNSQCVAWTFDQKNIECVKTNVVPGKCHLHSNIGYRDGESCRQSNIKIGKPYEDKPGGDLPGMPLVLPTGSTQSTCGAYCSRDPRCIAWSYDAELRKCRLKNVLKKSVGGSPSTKFVGVKGTIGYAYSGTVLPNMPVDLGHTASAHDCSALCDNTAACVGWNFANPITNCQSNNNCWLLSSLGTKVPNRCRVVGVKSV